MSRSGEVQTSAVTRSVLYREIGVVSAVGAAQGVLVVTISLLMGAARVPGFVLAVPWSQVAGLLALFALAAAAAALASSRRLTAGERVRYTG